MRKLYFFLLLLFVLASYESFSQPNDDCTGAITINCGQTINATTVGAGNETVANCVTSLTGAPGVWYTFVGDGSTVTLSLCGSAYDTEIGVFSGTCAALVCVTGNDDFCGASSQVSFPSVNGTTYFVLVTGFGGASGTFTLARTCASPPVNDACAGALPINCGQTINSTTVGAALDAVAGTCVTTLNTAPGVWYTFVGDGSTVTMSLCGSSYDTKIGAFTGTCAALVCVTGNDDFCGLQSSITFPTVNGTTYFVLVTGFTTNAGAFTLTRTCSAAIPNDLCTGALPINCGQTISGTTVGAGIDAATPTCVTTLNTAPGIWYTFLGDGSTVTLSLCGSAYDTKIGVFTGTCAALNCVTGNDDFCGLQSSVTFVATPGVTYYVIVTGFSSGAGAFTLARTCIPPNDLCANAIPISCGQTINGSSNGATADVAPTCTGTTNPGVWYILTGVGGTETLSTCAGASFDTKISIYSGTCSSLTCIAGNDDFCGVQSQVSFTGILGTTYYVLVHGFGGATGTFSLTRTCPPPCAGVPSPGAIAGPGTPVCSGVTVNLSVSGYSNVGGLSFQWKSSATAGGPYLPIAGATAPTYSFNAAATAYYIVTVTCNNAGGGSANTVEFPVRVSNLVHSNLLATPSVTCSPGASVISGTVSGSASAGNYTHTLTGAGTIGAPVLSGANNSNVSFSVTNIPAGVQNYTLTSTDAGGCSVVSTVTVTVNLTPVVTISATPPGPVCIGSIVRIDASATPAAVQTFTSLANTHIPAGGTTNGVSDLYPNPITVSGISAPNATVKSVTLNAYSHAFPDDVDIVLVSPSGQAVILMSDAGGATPATGQTFTFDDAAGPTLADATFNASGTYKPTNYGAGDTWPGVSGTPSSTTLSTFSGPANGDWKLYVFDDAVNNTGFIATWSITFNVPAPVVFSPLTNLFSDATAVTAYTGTPAYTVWAKPTAVSSVYTATATVNGCSGSASVTINLNLPPAIVTQPAPASQTICPGFNVVYTVGATGAGLTYQWRKNGVNMINAGFVSGVNTNTLTLSTVSVADNGTYDVVVSGTCSPQAISNGAVLTIATAPTITTQPVAQVVCVGTNAVFSVVAAGVPTPNIFQWQVSTNNGVTWTDLTTNGSYTSTLTVPNPNTTNNNNQYRVRITNNCGGAFLFSNAVLLNVNPVVQAVATDLWNQKICVTDTLVPLVGSPAGGSWSGNGVSGFNFVPAATGVGTYILTYTYTGNAGLGCTSTDTTKVIVVDCGERTRLLRNDAVILYPNPNNGHFYIKINSNLYNYLGMKVYDMSGRLVNGRSNGKVLESPVFGGLVYGRVVPIDLSYLPSGTYLVKFYYDGGIRSSEKGFLVVISHD